ncbi:delta-aminolevulinic acid dehydratase [Calothrix brevissima NIES-22]|nr:delta-aminolevulinic acid dehydratase [Calothrix brevissima NIES-22]
MSSGNLTPTTPVHRPRRLRRTATLRRMVQETTLTVGNSKK